MESLEERFDRVIWSNEYNTKWMEQYVPMYKNTLQRDPSGDLTKRFLDFIKIPLYHAFTGALMEYPSATDEQISHFTYMDTGEYIRKISRQWIVHTN